MSDGFCTPTLTRPDNERDVSQIGVDGATGNCSLVPFVMKRAKGAKSVTSKAEEYRRYARQCVEIAPTFQDEERRATLLGQAQSWLRLAHLAQANRQIAELAVQIVRQRAIVKHALDTGQGSEMAKSLLDALEGSVRIFESTGYFCSVATDHSARCRRVTPRTGGVCHDATGMARHDRLTNAWPPPSSVPADVPPV